MLMFYPVKGVQQNPAQTSGGFPEGDILTLLQAYQLLYMLSEKTEISLNRPVAGIWGRRQTNSGIGARAASRPIAAGVTAADTASVFCCGNEREEKQEEVGIHTLK